jgi:surfeit locus 1 family protein
MPRLSSGTWRWECTGPALLSALLFLTLLLTLGSWQAGRAQEKRALLDGARQAVDAAVLRVEQVNEDWHPLRWRSLRVQGRYAAGRQVLLDNQVQQGRVGYHVLTPLLLGGGEAVLVNRGWVPADAARQRLPDITVMDGARVVQGLLNGPPGVGLRMGRLEAAGRNWPRVLPWLDLDWLEQELNVKLKPYVLLLNPAEPDGYVRAWRPVAEGFGPEKHIGYAVTWYSCAAVFLALFLAATLRREVAK